MKSIYQQKTVEKGSKKVKKYILAIISLGITIALVAVIIYQVQLINQNGASPKIMMFIVVEGILIFVLPCIFNPQFALRRIFQPYSRGELIQSETDEMTPLPSLEFSADDHHPIIIKCPACHFENPGNRKRCLNCNSDLIW